MKSRTFRRFVAIFVGALLVFDLVLIIVTGEENLMLPTLLLSLVYAFYMIIFVRKEKQAKAGEKKQPQSPLMRK